MKMARAPSAWQSSPPPALRSSRSAWRSSTPAAGEPPVSAGVECCKTCFQIPQTQHAISGVLQGRSAGAVQAQGWPERYRPAA